MEPQSSDHREATSSETNPLSSLQLDTRLLHPRQLPTAAMSATRLQTKEPHFIPGYTGYCPQYVYRVGDTYGALTHKVLVDPCVTHSEQLVLSDRTTDDYQIFRPPQRVIDLVEARHRYGDPVYKHPMIPGYEGFVPRETQRVGQRYTVSASEALATFELEQQRDRGTARQLRRTTRLQDSRYCPRSLDDRQTMLANRRMPLEHVRPEHVGVIRCAPATEPALEPPYVSTSPYFMACGDPQKYIKTGACVHVPFGYGRCGEAHKAYTHSALCDFVHNFNRRRGTEWAPVDVTRPDPPLTLPPLRVYHENLGMLPHYGGHIPGAIFRCGKTYGVDSHDAKRWLRGNYHN